MFHATQKDTVFLIMMNKSALALILAASLTGCASNCTSHCLLGFGPGSSAFATVADYHDRRDPCQTRTHSDLSGQRLKPDGYARPLECASGPGQAVRITAPNGQSQTYWVRGGQR
jgi:hypothetical protein